MNPLVVLLPDAHATFDWLLRTSLHVALLVSVVMIVTMLAGRRLSPGCRHALWLLVAVRMALPVLPSSPWSVFNLFDAERAVATGNSVGVTVPEPETGWIITKDPLPGQPPQVMANVAEADRFEWNWRHALLLAWIIGVVAFLTRVIVANVIFARRIRRGTGVDDTGVIALLCGGQRDMNVTTPVCLIATDAVRGPALWGMLRPVMLIPPAMLRELSREDLRFVFLHELAHLKRRDIIADWILSLLHAFHWFNPAAWFALSRLRAERELSRDAMVLAATNPREERGYGQTILKLVQVISRPGVLRPGAVGILEEKSELKRRIAMIARFDRNGSRGRGLAVALALLIACLLLTDKRLAKGAAQEVHAEPTANERVAPTSVTELRIEREVRPDDREIADELERELPELGFDAVALGDVIDFLRDVSGENIFVNWKALEAAGVDRNTAVSVHVPRSTKFSEAMERILRHAAGGGDKLGFTVRDGVVTITTTEDLDSDTDIQVYDVRDLLAVDDEKDEQRATAKREALVKELTTLITETIDPPSWRKFGSIRHLSGQLIITATRRNHGEVRRMLNQLREARAIQISLEVRFISVTPDLIERHKIGRGAGKGAGLMNDEQTNAWVRATQQDAASTILTAPRVTLVNGQKGSVKVLQQNPYVADFKEVNGEFRPQLATQSSGVVFDVAATSSADRKHVTLDVHPQVTQLLELTEVPWKHAPPGRNDLKVQVPRETKAESKAVVSVPSGGTMAMVLEPALVGDDKAPEQRLVMLVKPTILVRPPAAQQPFPLINEAKKP